MKKTILLALLAYLSFTACDDDNDPKSNDRLAYVELSTKEFESIPDQISIKVVNNSEDDIFYSPDYLIEYFQENKWTEVSFSPLAFTAIDINYKLEAGNSEEIVVNFYNDFIFHEYKKGKYRIAKSLGGNKHYLEFEVKKDSPKRVLVYMEVNPKIFESIPDQVRVKLTNNSKDMLRYYPEYKIEHFKDNSWVEIPIDIDFGPIASKLEAGKSTNFTVDFSEAIAHYKYKDGKFRIAKHFFNRHYYAEFEVKEDSPKTDNDSIYIKLSYSIFNKVPDKITAKIINNSKNEITYGLDYSFEYYERDKWIPVTYSIDILTPDILCIQKSGESRDANFYLYKEYANYREGKYRVIKKLGHSSYKNYYAEFEIKF